MSRSPFNYFKKIAPDFAGGGSNDLKVGINKYRLYG